MATTVQPSVYFSTTDSDSLEESLPLLLLQYLKPLARYRRDVFEFHRVRLDHTCYR